MTNAAKCRAQLAWHQRRVAELAVRTWEDDDPEITDSTRLAAMVLGMPPSTVWKVMEVWSACAGLQIAVRRAASVGVSEEKEKNNE